MTASIRPRRGLLPVSVRALSTAVWAVLAAMMLPQAGRSQKPLDPASAAEASAQPQPVLGERAGTERWVVHFHGGRLDLAPLREAHLLRREGAAVGLVVADLERAMQARQREFVAAAEAEGARVLRQWWLVDACELEVTPTSLETLRDHADVARVEAVRRVFPVIREATNDRNHAADRVQDVLGIRGAGVAVGIIDTGVDEDMGRIGRPHRVFYPGGDIGNTNGGGIRGSRLLVSRRIGLLGPDDPHGHGTGVASIAVGGGWGSVGADAGHADAAGLCSYAIADEPLNGGTTTANLAQAWQQLVVDRAQFGIAVANLSYSGSPRPGSIDQRALDSAARNADVLITVAAGNNGSSTLMSQSAANGIAVAAVAADRHGVASFSSRGPLFGSERFYPDIAACGMGTVMARRDAEALDYVASGTSMAAPQVAGAAALCRSAAPGWSALETKAALLITARDISASNPTLDRNAYGMGLLRDDHAVELALGRTGSVSLASVDQATTAWSRSFPVQVDTPYAVAVTWHRDPALNDDWSDLALEVVDDRGRALAIADTPENLYEIARFIVRDPTVQSVTMRVTLDQLQPGLSSQDFGWAMSEITSFTVTGAYRPMARGCAGTGLPATGTDCIEHNVSGPWVEAPSHASFEVAFQATAPVLDLRVAGFEVYGRLEGAQFGTTLAARIYGVGTDGAPGSLLATGTLQGSTQSGWQRATLDAPVDLPAGTPFYVAVDNRRGDFPVLRDSFQSRGERIGWSLRVSGTSTWVVGSPISFAVRVLCDTSPRPTVPTLTSASVPTVGRVLDLRMSQVPAGAPVAVCTGASATRFGALLLPFDLTPFGAPGCLLRTSFEIADSFAADAAGVVRAPLLLPPANELVGRTFYQQAVVLDTAANRLAATLSDANEVLVGGVAR